MNSNIRVHATALVESEAIGEGTAVWAYAHIMSGASVGGNCNIGDHAFIESGAVVGNNVTIKNGVLIWEGVTIADGVFVGPGVCFTNDLRPRSPRLPIAQQRYSQRQNWLAKSYIAEGASLGAGAVIVAGITIGAYAMIAAGAVVTRDVAPYALVRGNPARQSGWVCRCGNKLLVQNNKHVENSKVICGECDTPYSLSENQLSIFASGG